MQKFYLHLKQTLLELINLVKESIKRDTMENNWLFFNDFKNTSIRHSNHDKTGSVDDVVLDLQTGEIVLFTLSSGGFLGMGEDKIALPPQALNFRAGEAGLLVDSTRIQNAPGTNTDWPERMDSTFIADVNKHYGHR